MSKQFPRAVLLLGLATAAAAQTPQDAESAAAVALRIRNGGWFETSQWRRGDDGALQLRYFGDSGSSEAARFMPLLGGELGRGLSHGGLVGLLALVCHGHGDLVGMTDAAFHLGALGVGSDEVQLRQLLVVAPASFEGPRGRAEALDHMIAIDTLVRLGARGAAAELAVLAAMDHAPAPLRERARRGLALLQGMPDPLVRKRLDPEGLLLPAAFDGIAVIDHARLPDLSWLTAVGRRLAAIVSADTVARFDGTWTAAMRNSTQSLCDLGSELPFELARRYGNARVDQSVVVVSARADEQRPFAVTWQGVGEFEAEGWAKARLESWMWSDSPLFGAGSFAVHRDRFVASTDGTTGIARPSLVERLGLLRETGSAIRAIVPGNSKLWAAVAFLGVPAATSVELSIAFGGGATLRLEVTTRDEDAAAAWQQFLRDGLLRLQQEFERSHEALAQCRELKALVAALAAARVTLEDEVVVAVAALPVLQPADWERIGAALAR